MKVYVVSYRIYTSSPKHKVDPIHNPDDFRSLGITTAVVKGVYYNKSVAEKILKGIKDEFNNDQTKPGMISGEVTEKEVL